MVRHVGNARTCFQISETLLQFYQITASLPTQNLFPRCPFTNQPGSQHHLSGCEPVTMLSLLLVKRPRIAEASGRNITQIDQWYHWH
jgi:hypothetical protein